jgi:hypothetical protein
MARFVLPDWVRTMIDASAGAPEGIRWFTSDERVEAYRGREQTFPAERLWLTDEQKEAANADWQYKVKVGEGPKIYTDHALGVQLGLWVDGKNPDALLAALPNHPPFLWFPVGCDEATMLATLRPYLPQELRQPRKHIPPAAIMRYYRDAGLGDIPGPLEGQTESVRLIVGLAIGALDQRELRDVENHLVVAGAADVPFLMLGTSMDNPRSNPAVTVVRTLHSQSTVRLDWWDALDGSLFAEIFYSPANHQETIGAFNERFGLHFPPDIPVDVACLLLGLEATDVSALLEYMELRHDRPDFLQSCLNCLKILTYPNHAEALRPFSTHPSPLVRKTVIFLAAQGADDLLRAMRTTETDPELRAQIDEALAD